MADLAAYDKLLSDDETESSPASLREYPKVRRGWLYPSITIALLASISLNAVFIFSALGSQTSDSVTIKHTQRYWSPILDSIRISYDTILFNVTLFSKSIYRENASPEVDQAWTDLGLITTQIIPEQDGERVGFAPGMVKRRESDGGGFIAQMEVFHQLHCLDTLRQGLYFNYEYYHTNRQGVWERSDQVVRRHMGHCLDLLRVQLQCTADVGLVGMLWVNASGTLVPFANFKTEHKCRDFDAIRAWALENDEKGVVETRPGDDIFDKFP